MKKKDNSRAECMFVVYYIVFAMENESTIVNSKKIQILYYC